MWWRHSTGTPSSGTHAIVIGNLVGTPELLFLHGSVAIGCCQTCKRVASRSLPCSNCGQELSKIPILYPVTEKNYNADPVIAEEWRLLKSALEQAWAFTIFGYSAPKTDVEAIELMKGGWGKVDERNLEEVEIIDIREPEELRNSWDRFIHTHHSTVTSSFLRIVYLPTSSPQLRSPLVGTNGCSVHYTFPYAPFRVVR